MNAALRFTAPPRFDVTGPAQGRTSNTVTVCDVPAHDVRPLVESWLRPAELGDSREQIAILQRLTDLDVRLRTTGLDETTASRAAALGVHIEQVPA